MLLETHSGCYLRPNVAEIFPAGHAVNAAVVRCSVLQRLALQAIAQQST